MKPPISRRYLDIAIERLAERFGEAQRIRRAVANRLERLHRPCRAARTRDAERRSARLRDASVRREARIQQKALGYGAAGNGCKRD